MMLIRRMEIPVIAEVRGIAAAAGCQLVATCDVVVASDTSKFVVPGQKVGLFCSTPGIPLARAVPHKIALDMLLTGEPIDAQTALRCGLVSRIVPEKDVKFEALKVAEQIGQHSRAVTALGKKFFYSQTELGVSDAYRFGGKIMTENLKFKDAQEGINAFVEKRKPSFRHTDEKV
ncbi:enoyl-CoA hydratase family protein [Ancylostoma caninum]|uniref:Enoyl-CoA hydratase domain-containing protein 3, mitochondrial n=1 Tax=Ancylostoma caninum TaxID=29170 RepID=A0A368G1S9_ANCCA|nr:enoyl-CoA hydratase family protein [Ancylostoma caninum]